MDISATLKAIVILGIDGKRLLAKYSDTRINMNQFEKKIFSRTKSRKNRDEILIEDSYMILHKSINDLHIYVVGARNENPLILDKVLVCLIEVTTVLLNRNVEYQNMLDNIDQIILALDEICDGGTVIETDPNLVIDRVCLKEGVADQSMAQVFQTAAEHIRFPWIR